LRCEPRLRELSRRGLVEWGLVEWGLVEWGLGNLISSRKQIASQLAPALPSGALLEAVQGLAALSIIGRD